ncbi:HNH endonuclease signature motif containing protein [Streptomyces sp. AC495_CC817]|uniref:HNH endonuclease signature motif containing protein n=1 Tax=Streptomyces sp. AC495_CC817 TaxID=2823900 RepID=UPI001C25E201|nr:HNH endonuclease signature motif containing protein [Streptomyces sp. AC495_CC817]
MLRAAGEVTRLVEAVIVESIADDEATTMPDACGCRSMNELLQRVLRVDAAGAQRLVSAARLVRRDVSLGGERLPARWPGLRDALLDGELGVSGLLAATAPLERVGDRIGVDDRLLADAELAAQARGLTVADDGSMRPAPPATPDDLKQYAQLVSLYLDPDGAAPTEARASQSRALTIGRLRDGTYPIRGSLLPEVYAQLQLVLDAQLNPRVAGAPDLGVRFRPSAADADHVLRDADANADAIVAPARDDADADADADAFADAFAAAAVALDDVFADESCPDGVIDTRTRAQKQHDAFAAALGIAARHEDMPSLGGAAPTLVVHVDADQFSAPLDAGWATLPGVEAPVSAAVAVHTACTGAVQRVLVDEGRIIGISTTDRVFSAHQRRAIVLRDGECLIPGCHVPASWCEIHHVIEHSRGGPTHTDNGVPLCWHHHRTIDRSGWEIRMRDGVPEIRGPAWWDPERQWRPPRRPTAPRVAVRASPSAPVAGR